MLILRASKEKGTACTGCGQSLELVQDVDNHWNLYRMWSFPCVAIASKMIETAEVVTIIKF